jgi:hypothetical protein
VRVQCCGIVWFLCVLGSRSVTVSHILLKSFNKFIKILCYFKANSHETVLVDILLWFKCWLSFFFFKRFLQHFEHIYSPDAEAEEKSLSNRIFKLAIFFLESQVEFNQLSDEVYCLIHSCDFYLIMVAERQIWLRLAIMTHSYDIPID